MNTCARPGCTKPAGRQGWCNSHYENWRHKQHGYGRWEEVTIYTDAEPARSHVQKLLDAGMGTRRIAELAGVNRTTIGDLMSAHESRNMPEPSRRIHRSNATRLLSVPIPSKPFEYMADGNQIPTLGSSRRLQALVASGWTQTELADRLGMKVTNLSKITHGQQGLITSRKAREIDELFEELQMTPGVSARAVNQARAAGWAPPFAWDEGDLDDPEARPQVVKQRFRGDSLTERRAEVARLTRLGLPASTIASRLGITTRTVGRDRAAS